VSGGCLCKNRIDNGGGSAHSQINALGRFMDRLRTAQALALQNAMLETRKTLNEAHEKYRSAFEIAMDTVAGADGRFALRREGEVYAQALHRYTEASMAWLGYVDRNVRPPFKTKGS
jgi:hypothetical protein